MCPDSLWVYEISEQTDRCPEKFSALDRDEGVRNFGTNYHLANEKCLTRSRRALLCYSWTIRED
jgi:hypothetical protein